jgi:hypothetical protein
MFEITQGDKAPKKRNHAKYDTSLATLTTSAPLSLSESKVVFSVIAQIDIEDGDFKEYKITASELYESIRNELRSEARKRSRMKGKEVEVMDIAKDKSKQLEIFCKNLRAKSLNLPVENSLDWDIRGWFDAFTYKSEEDAIYCQFHPDLKPYLLDFKNKHFKKADTRNIFMFSSKYSHKFYLLLKTVNTDRYVTYGEFESALPLKWIREWLGIEEHEYERYNDFKRFILKTVQKDLKEKAEVTFDFEEIKIKRTVTHLKIKAKYKEKATTEEEEREQDTTPTQVDLPFEEYDDTLDMKYDLKYFNDNPENKKMLINNEVHYLKQLYFDKDRNNKLTLKTDRTEIKFNNKNLKKTLDEIYCYIQNYKSK